MDEKLKAVIKEVCDKHWEQDYYIASLDDFKNGTECSAVKKDGTWKPCATFFSVYTSVQECIDKTCNKTGSWKIYKVQPLDTLGHKVNSEWLTTRLTILKYVRTVSVMN